MWEWLSDNENKPKWPRAACEETLIRMFVIYNLVVFLRVHFKSSIFTSCQCVLDNKNPELHKRKKHASNCIVATHLGLFQWNISCEQRVWLSLFYFFFPFFLWHCGLRPWLHSLFHFPNRPWSTPHSSFHQFGRLKWSWNCNGLHAALFFQLSHHKIAIVKQPASNMLLIHMFLMF